MQKVVANFLRKTNLVVAMSKFSQRQLLVSERIETPNNKYAGARSIVVLCARWLVCEQQSTARFNLRSESYCAEAEGHLLVWAWACVVVCGMWFPTLGATPPLRMLVYSKCGNINIA